MLVSKQLKALRSTAIHSRFIFLCDTGCVANQIWYVSVFQIYHWIIDLHDFPQIAQQLLGTTQALQEHCCQMRSQ